MKNRILLLIFGGLLTTTLSFSQKCGTYPGSLEEDIKKYPHFYQSLESKNAELKLQNEKALAGLKNLKSEDGVKIIPVVVHVIHDMGNENISDASIQGAIDILNANINGQSANFLSKTLNPKHLAEFPLKHLFIKKRRLLKHFSKIYLDVLDDFSTITVANYHIK